MGSKLLSDQAGVGVSSGPIPKVVYQTGPSRRLDKRHFEDVSQFRALNTDFDFLFFDDEEQLEYMRLAWLNHPIFEVYSSAKWPQMRADIFRYCIVYERGGWYCDINKGIFLSLSSLMEEGAELITSSERNELTIFPEISVSERMLNPHLYVIQWAFAASKGSRFLERLLDDIVLLYERLGSNKFSSVKMGVLTVTGPGAFNRSLRFHLALDPLEKWNQVGVDFYGKGRYRLRGTEGSRFERKRHYSKASADFIFSQTT